MSNRNLILITAKAKQKAQKKKKDYSIYVYMTHAGDRWSRRKAVDDRVFYEARDRGSRILLLIPHDPGSSKKTKTILALVASRTFSSILLERPTPCLDFPAQLMYSLPCFQNIPLRALAVLKISLNASGTIYSQPCLQNNLLHAILLEQHLPCLASRTIQSLLPKQSTSSLGCYNLLNASTTIHSLICLLEQSTSTLLKLSVPSLRFQNNPLYALASGTIYSLAWVSRTIHPLPLASQRTYSMPWPSRTIYSPAWPSRTNHPVLLEQSTPWSWYVLHRNAPILHNPLMMERYWRMAYWFSCRAISDQE